jgi:hypothetical protein
MHPILRSARRARYLYKIWIKLPLQWKNLRVRHQESKKLIDLPVLTSDDAQEINLTEMASRTTIQCGELNLEALADVDISPYYQHTAQLPLHLRYAEGIANDIISAKIYSEEIPSVYILLLHNKAYHGVFYNPQKLELREPNIVNVLGTIACQEVTEIANVDYDEVEN